MPLNVDDLTRQLGDAKNARANWDSVLQQIADRVLPQASDFVSHRPDGTRRTEIMFDATAALSAQKAVAAISTFIWPPNQQYQKLEVSNDHLAKDRDTQIYLDLVTRKLFKARYAPRAGFEAAMGDHALQGFVFGTGLQFVDDNVAAQSLRYKALHLGQCYLREDQGGRVDTVFRCWQWTLRQVEQRFPGRLPETLAAKLAKNPDERIEVAHAVLPHGDYDPRGPGYLGMPWASCYWIPSERVFLDRGGFHEWPFGIMRYPSTPGEVYGRSPAWLALSDVKVLNAMKRTVLQAAQQVVDPPLLLPDLDVLGGSSFSMANGALNFGGVNSQGQQLVHPLNTGGRVEVGIEMMDKEREIIASAFLLDVFRVLVENPNMTATQTLELLQERATMLSPIGGRIEGEDLGPVTEREIGILTRAGQLPPMPPAMIEARGEYKITYTSPMRQAMRASEAIAITRTFEQVIPLAEADPSALDAYDVPAAARLLGEINGVPPQIMRDVKDMQARTANRQQQAQQQAIVEAAPQVSAAAKNITLMQAAGGRPQV